MSNSSTLVFDAFLMDALLFSGKCLNMYFTNIYLQESNQDFGSAPITVNIRRKTLLSEQEKSGKYNII